MNILTHTKAKIYLADQRGCSQNEKYRSYHTFNFGSYFNANRKPLGCLQTFNEDTFRGGHTVKHRVKKDTAVLLLPVVGGVSYRYASTNGLLEAGQSHVFFVSKDSEFELSNPYENELINFLQIWFTIPTAEDTQPRESEFDLQTLKNELIPFLSGVEEKNLPVRAYIGKFDGRAEGAYTLKESSNSIFIFIIEGAFEVQNRLLHPRDGLALSNTNQIEFEALSNEGIILLLEFSLK